jgi:hypothetical protein
VEAEVDGTKSAGQADGAAEVVGELEASAPSDVGDGGMEAGGGRRERLGNGGGVERDSLEICEGVRCGGDPGLDAWPAIDRVELVLGPNEDGVAGGRVELRAVIDTDERLAGVDADDLVGGLERRTASLAGLDDEASQASATVGVRRFRTGRLILDKSGQGTYQLGANIAACWRAPTKRGIGRG